MHKRFTSLALWFHSLFLQGNCVWSKVVLISAILCSIYWPQFMFVCQLLNKGQLQVSEKLLKILTEKRSEEKRHGAHKILDGNQWKKAVMAEMAIVPIFQPIMFLYRFTAVWAAAGISVHHRRKRSYRIRNLKQHHACSGLCWERYFDIFMHSWDGLQLPPWPRIR